MMSNILKTPTTKNKLFSSTMLQMVDSKSYDRFSYTTRTFSSAQEYISQALLLHLNVLSWLDDFLHIVYIQSHGRFYMLNLEIVSHH